MSHRRKTIKHSVISGKYLTVINSCYLLTCCAGSTCFVTDIKHDPETPTPPDTGCSLEITCLDSCFSRCSTRIVYSDLLDFDLAYRDWCLYSSLLTLSKIQDIRKNIVFIILVC